MKHSNNYRRLQFTKMHGLGNDFVVFDVQKTPINFPKETLQFIARRRTGVGCDQILLVELSTHPKADYNYRIFNADGTEATHCGNGARCIIEYLHLQQKIKKTSIVLNLNNRLITGQKNSDGTISLNMGLPSFKPTAIPFLQPENPENLYSIEYDSMVKGSNVHNIESIQFGIAFVGNPHAIIRVDNVAELQQTDRLTRIGRFIQKSLLFPKGVNVNFYVITANGKISLRTYERGSGFTLACGTGAIATVSYAISQNQIARQVEVAMPGGNLSVSWDGVHEIIMTGAASYVFRGEIDVLC